MNGGFPKYSGQARKGEKGVQIVSRIVGDTFGWLFRRNHEEHDFGIDAHTDVVTENGDVTGQMLALQIKYGASFFKEKTKWGYVFRGDKKHFNYLSNYPTPVLIVLCHHKTEECYWVVFDPEKTSRAGENWKITVPFENTLADGKERISGLLPEPADYLGEIQDYWALNDVLMSYSVVVSIIGREEIEQRDTSYVRSLFDRLTKTKELAAHCQGSVELAFHGYDDDPRELYEIPDVRAFVPCLVEALPELFFFVYTGDKAQSLKMIALCLSDLEVAERDYGQRNVRVEFKTQKMAEFLQSHFPGLNHMTEWLEMPREENKRISMEVFRTLGFEPPAEDA